MICQYCQAKVMEGVPTCPNCGQPVPVIKKPDDGPIDPGNGGHKPQQSNGLAIASLCLGIVSLLVVFCVPFIGLIAAIPAVVTGHIALSQIAKSHDQMKGRSMAIAGLVVGYIDIVFFFVAWALSTIMMNSFGFYR